MPEAWCLRSCPRGLPATSSRPCAGDGSPRPRGLQAMPSRPCGRLCWRRRTMPSICWSSTNGQSTPTNNGKCHRRTWPCGAALATSSSQTAPSGSCGHSWLPLPTREASSVLQLSPRPCRWGLSPCGGLISFLTRSGRTCQASCCGTTLPMPLVGLSRWRCTTPPTSAPWPSSRLLPLEAGLAATSAKTAPCTCCSRCALAETA